ncbi:hypothetical protein QA596_04515 [Balneolales bacterium ANBcel1]|nr:hypothetical protein [Balneolales bacterium ANBcel1]
MNIQSFIAVNRHTPGDERRDEIHREKTATEFEELFARHLVQQMTKGAFDMEGGASGVGQSSALYREFITDALAGELAAQRKLGMAEMVEKYWERLEANHPAGKGETDETGNAGMLKLEEEQRPLEFNTGVTGAGNPEPAREKQQEESGDN